MTRIRELDGLRGIASVGVVLYHTFPYVFYAGWIGVDMFFVLSGYLITTLIRTEMDHPGFLTTFYLRRAFRILPVYYLTILVLLVANHYTQTGHPTDGLLANVFFMQTMPHYWGGAISPFIGTFGPSWSIAIEEQYYLIWPLLLLLLGWRSVPFLSLGFLAVCLAARFILADSIDLMLTRGDGLALGCLLAWLLDRWSPTTSRSLRRLLLGVGALGFVYTSVYLVVFFGSPAPTWWETSITGFSLFFFAVIGLSVAYSGGRLLAPLRHPVLCWLGTISYAMYLFHTPILTYSRHVPRMLGLHHAWLEHAVTAILLFALPAASWYCLERPLQRLRRSMTMPAILPPGRFAVGRTSS